MSFVGGGVSEFFKACRLVKDSHIITWSLKQLSEAGAEPYLCAESSTLYSAAIVQAIFLVPRPLS